jgi:hypothetical protein
MKLPSNIFEAEAERTIPKRFLLGVGRVIVAHARLEQYVVELIGALQRLDGPLVRQVFDGASTRENMIKIIRLVEMWKIEPTEPLEELRADVEKAGQKRNDIAHGIWLRTPRHDIALRLMRGDRMTEVGMISRRVLPHVPPTRVEMFKEHVTYIEGVTDRIRKLYARVQDQLEPWPYISPARQHQHPWHPSQDRNGKTP